MGKHLKVEDIKDLEEIRDLVEYNIDNEYLEGDRNSRKVISISEWNDKCYKFEWEEDLTYNDGSIFPDYVIEVKLIEHKRIVKEWIEI